MPQQKGVRGHSPTRYSGDALCNFLLEVEVSSSSGSGRGEIFCALESYIFGGDLRLAGLL